MPSCASNVYMKYVNENVFAPAGLPTISCKPTDGTQQGLTYKYAAPDGPGGDFGDFTSICGAHGWFLSASQLGKYFQTLNTTNKIVPRRCRHECAPNFLDMTSLGTSTHRTA